MKTFYKFLFFTLILIIATSCARTGRPEGGPKDEDAPLFVTANPPYESINFNKKEIKIEFDEFVVLKNLNDQLVVSPPMKNPPLITPQGTASREIKIEILDTLKQNTTYIFNFGNAVEDNNEGNKLENFKYVFSTGSYIDSLTTSGSIKDSKLKETPKSVNVLLYRIDTAFNDSIVYKKKPNYITNTLDTTNFKFTNLRKGKYLMVALKEEINDYIFNPVTDKIGFYTDTLQLPKDSIITKPIILFQEDLPYEFKRGKEVTKGKIEFGFVGDAKDMKVNLLSKVPDTFKSVSKFRIDKDTLNYWFTPIDVDSLNFTISNNEFLDTLTVKLRKKKLDSLEITTTVRNTLHFRDTFFISSNNPIVKIDTTKISLFDKDTIAVNYKVLASKKENKIAFLFDKKPEDKYNFKALPEAFNDVFGIKNDTLNYNFSTKEIEDYGRITLNVNNVNNKNIIIEILSGSKQEQLVERKFITTSTKVVFDLLEPSKYTIRAIVDTNKNNKWDTGNYLNKQLAEEIIYHKEINNADLRANFFLVENFTID
ncbi:Ig-like domain-containing protein [Polaribacter vadi]|uniref:Ig-like domain-containing protein n=1 Tax=Polaribacter TaxID=52959 RepID=UPI001C095369|nr:Ig-like domain-containing protein [Polaribacter sp. 1_MG-2023]MBU3010223.1 Ig-like domain-containing protein [Polaribacter vadi]MDO6740029.1 Ig-like domain-containing protein [Polaribacter sp. 1_MG-2023]